MLILVKYDRPEFLALVDNQSKRRIALLKTSFILDKKKMNTVTNWGLYKKKKKWLKHIYKFFMD